MRSNDHASDTSLDLIRNHRFRILHLDWNDDKIGTTKRRGTFQHNYWKQEGHCPHRTL